MTQLHTGLKCITASLSRIQSVLQSTAVPPGVVGGISRQEIIDAMRNELKEIIGDNAKYQMESRGDSASWLIIVSTSTFSHVRREHDQRIFQIQIDSERSMTYSIMQKGSGLMQPDHYYANKLTFLFTGRKSVYADAVKNAMLPSSPPPNESEIILRQAMIDTITQELKSRVDGVKGFNLASKQGNREHQEEIDSWFIRVSRQKDASVYTVLDICVDKFGSLRYSIFDEGFSDHRSFVYKQIFEYDQRAAVYADAVAKGALPA